MAIGGSEALEASDSAGSQLDFLDLGGEIAARSPLQLFWRRLRQDRVALISGGFIVFLIVLAIAAPLVIKILGLPGPNVQNLNLTDEFGSPLGPTSAHPFGVDQLGEDVMSRVIYGTRISLEVGIIGTALSTVIGVAVRPRRRLLPRLGRHAHLAHDRRRAVDPAAAARDRDRRGLRRQGLHQGRDPTGAVGDHLPDRVRDLAVHGEDRPRARAVAARARVRRCVARARRLERAASCCARSCRT